jgi:hypothetical protein
MPRKGGLKRERVSGLSSEGNWETPPQGELIKEIEVRDIKDMDELAESVGVCNPEDSTPCHH